MRSVGITRVGDGFGYRAVRNGNAIFAAAGRPPSVASFANVPVIYADTPGEIEALVRIPSPGAAAAINAGTPPERRHQRPLICGLQIQNFDDDDREGVIPDQMVVGTLGCFGGLSGGERALISNNHVIAGENRGMSIQDRILQPGSSVHSTVDQAAILADFEPLLFSAPGSTVADRSASLNIFDAGIAVVDPGVQITQGFHPSRQLPQLVGTAPPRIGETVFKVGSTTGLRYGKVVDIDTTVGPINYPSGLCWFQQSFVIESTNRSVFSAGGDSGSAIVNLAGEVLGLLYATNAQQTYACQIGPILQRFGCILVSP